MSNQESVPQINYDLCERCEEHFTDCQCYCNCGNLLVNDEEKDLGSCQQCLDKEANEILAEQNANYYHDTCGGIK